MNAKFPVAATAALMADPARAAILTTLLDGRAVPAGELARVANVSAQSASMHLAQLLNGGLLRVSPEGRRRYYRIASPDVAHAIEALGVISTAQRHTPGEASDPIRYARTCYDHLAGELAVRLAEWFESSGLLINGNRKEYALTQRGEEFFSRWNIEVAKLRAERRMLARRCLDWTERRHHVAGALGAAIYQKFTEFCWIARDGGDRTVRVTPDGSRHLSVLLRSGR